MKLAGITWWRNNYGSILQAYALQAVLNEYEGITYEIINQYGKKIASLDNLLDKLKTVGFIQTMRRLVWRFGLKKLRMRVVNMQRFIDEYLKISSDVFNEETISVVNKYYDGFVCGSDQIWNPVLSPISSMYWLDFVKPGKLKIAYAPSIGVNTAAQQEKQQIKAVLSDFNWISCREESGAKLINEILGSERCKTVVDPTLLVEKSFWDKVCTPRKYTEKYIFVYMLRGTKQQRKLIESFAKEVNLPIVTIPFLDNEKIELYDFKFGDIKCWDASPADFISLISNAEYVFADSFHSMVFSTIYHRPFYAFPKIGKDKKSGDSQISRMKDLQSTLGIPDRIISESVSVKELMAYPEIDWARVDLFVQEKRESSAEYLTQALSCKCGD